MTFFERSRGTVGRLRGTISSCNEEIDGPRRIYLIFVVMYRCQATQRGSKYAQALPPPPVGHGSMAPVEGWQGRIISAWKNITEDC